MNNLTSVIVYSFISGITVFLGGFLRSLERFPASPRKDEILHTITAFGGGILVSAVALVLIPEGMEYLSLFPIIIIFISGSVFFFFLDKAVSGQSGSKAQLLAMLMDFIPEAIALGAVFVHDKKLGLLLAIFIGLQNLPESFNAYSDMVKSGLSSRKTLLIFVPLSFCGVLGAVLGYFFLSPYDDIIGALMLFSGAGILYLIFQDIAPLAKIKNSRFPALGASLGFLVGVIGQKIIG